jgi:pullulanase/glycogen debranching enzyme
MPKGSFGGGQVGSTHLMTRRLIIDSLVYLTDTYKVDGFRFDMMGNLDLDTITQAYEKVSALNPQTLWIGEGWRTFNGDYGISDVTPADQDAMHLTDAVSVFSDEVRNELKSGFGIEGQPRFLTDGKRTLSLLYSNMIAQPGNVSEDDPGDIVQYIEAHDNLTLHDVIALSIKKDPKTSEEEILRRQCLGNALLLTHQGIVFLHSGQEYGRTKQFRHSDYISKVDMPPAKSTFMADAEGNPFE